MGIGSSDDDDIVMDGFNETGGANLRKNNISINNGLPKPPPRHSSKKIQQVNDEFIDALVQQAQPPHVALSDFEQMVHYKDEEDVDNILDDEDEAVIKSM